MAEGRKISFFITRPRKSEASSAEKPMPELVYGLDANGIPYTRDKLPAVKLFGGMRQSYCDSLALVINCHEGVRLKVPQFYEHPGFHGDEVVLSYAELLKHIETLFGRIKDLPKGVFSMGDLFERIKLEALKKHNNPRPSG